MGGQAKAVIALRRLPCWTARSPRRSGVTSATRSALTTMTGWRRTARGKSAGGLLSTRSVVCLWGAFWTYFEEAGEGALSCTAHLSSAVGIRS